MTEQQTIDADMPKEVHRILYPRRKWPWVLLAMVAAFVVAILLVRVVMHVKVSGQLARIPADEPRTPAELDAWYPEPEGENAARAWLNACSFIVPAAQGKDELLPVVGQALVALWNPMPPEVLEASQAHLKSNAEALHLLHEAARIRGGRYPVDLSQGFAVPLAHLMKLRVGARLLGLDAMVAAQNGDADRAVRDIETQLALADSLKAEPLLISMLVRCALIAVAKDMLQRSLTHGSLEAAQLERLQKAFSEIVDDEVLHRALVGERAAGNSVFDASLTEMRGSVARSPGTAGCWLYTQTGIRELDRYHYLRLVNAQVEAARTSPGAAVLAAQPNTQVELEALPRYCFLTLGLLPALGSASRQHLLSIARAQAAAAACAAERFRLATGALPGTLAELVPKYLGTVPTDPFQPTGGPLIYRRIGPDGFAIYTVGANGIDNGFPAPSTTGHDYGVTVRSPKPPVATE